MHQNAGTAGAAALVFLVGLAVGKLWLPQRRYGLGKPHPKVPRRFSLPAPPLANDAMLPVDRHPRCAALPPRLLNIVIIALPSQAWLLVINVEFKSVEDRDMFIEHFEPVAAHCAKVQSQLLDRRSSLLLDSKNHGWRHLRCRIATHDKPLVTSAFEWKLRQPHLTQCLRLPG